MATITTTDGTQAAVVVLDIGDRRAILLLPAHGEEAVAERYDLGISDLGPGPFLDLEPQLRSRQERQVDQ